MSVLFSNQSGSVLTIPENIDCLKARNSEKEFIKPYLIARAEL